MTIRDRDANEARWALGHALIQSTLEAIRASVRGIVRGERPRTIELAIPLPFSRADARDYVRLVDLWNEAGVLARAQLAVRECPACASKNHRFVLKSYDGYPFHGCEDCGTWFVPLVVDEQLIEKFFEQVPEARAISDRMMAGRDSKTKAPDHERFFAYFDLLAPMLRAKSGRVRYLDIGCGVGHSVELATELGMDAVGLETSRVAIETARRGGRKVYHPGEWSSQQTFDLVSLFETLEHVTDPNEMIRQARALLAPGGVLIITVPNVQCWEIQLLKDRCLHVFGGSEQVGHINLFSPDGLRQLFARHGLEVVHFDGQFGSNLLSVAAGLIDPRRSVLNTATVGEQIIRLPQSLHAVLNALGPDLSVLDRALLRSPILIAVACRKEDVEHLTPAVALLERRRSEGLMAALSRPPEPSMARPMQLLPEVLAPSPLFETGTPISDFLSPDVSQALRVPGFVASVASGLSLRSAAPVRFERLAVLGKGCLAAGCYALAAQMKVRRGLVTLQLLDEVRQTWAATIVVGPDVTEFRTDVALDRDSDVTLYLCANNSDAAAPVDVDIFDIGIAALDGKARLIPPPPEPDRSVVPPLPLFQNGAPIEGFLQTEIEGVLARRGFVGSAALGLSLRSAEPLQYERVARLGGGRLSSGRYEIAARVQCRSGLVAICVLDENCQTWAASVPISADATSVGAEFRLEVDTDVTLYVCANNSEGPAPVDVEIFDVGIRGFSSEARQIPPPPVPQVPPPLMAGNPLLVRGRVLPGFLLPAYAGLLAGSGAVPAVRQGLSLNSAAALRFEYMVLVGEGRLSAGSYDLAAELAVHRGNVSVSLLDAGRQAWIAALTFERGRQQKRLSFTLDAATAVALYVCANNSEAPEEVEVEVLGVGLAALDDAAGLETKPVSVLDHS